MFKKELRLRHEAKYTIDYSSYLYLTQKIKGVLPLDKNAGVDGKYHIRTLYFDDYIDSALYEKEAGIAERKKYRIRIYDFKDGYIRLEKKIKKGDLVGKINSVITIDQFYKIVDCRDLDFLIRSQDELLNELYVKIRVDLLRPRIIVDYVREAYTYHAGNIRITFDSDLKYSTETSDIFSDSVQACSVPVDNKIILEVKYDNFIPDHIRYLLSIEGALKKSVSKYAICLAHYFRVRGY